MRARQVRITDTTLRDGHQSLWATRMRTPDMLPILELMDSIGFHSLECWGGATFDASLRFLDEDPWERLRLIKKHVARTPLQMLLRGQNLVGYRHYGDDIVRRFVYKAAENGMDIFRVFDALNDIRNFETAAAAIKETGKHFQGAVVYTISPVHSLDHYVDVAHALVDMGADSICIKDMAALLSPFYAEQLVGRLKAEIDGAHPAALPLHRRPRPDDLPEGHRGRRGRHRHGHGAARLRQLAAGHRDGRRPRSRARPTTPASTSRSSSRSPSTSRRCARRAAASAASPRSRTCRSTRTRCPAA